MKELIETLNLDLSNISEKGYKDFYINEYYTDIPQEWDLLAKDLCDKIAKENFELYNLDSTHTFIDANDELVKPFGLDKITVCPYKGFEMIPWLNSNYIFIPYEKKCLTIDIYDCLHLTYEEIYDFIIQELYNFKRDATWVKNGVYEEKMKLMENGDLY